MLRLTHRVTPAEKIALKALTQQLKDEELK